MITLLFHSDIKVSKFSEFMKLSNSTGFMVNVCVIMYYTIM